MKWITIFFIALLSLCVNATSFGVEPDWTAYDKLLKQHVKPGKLEGIALMRVDYPGIKNNVLYPQVVAQLKNYDTRKLQGKEEKLAFYINAYNILAIKMVLDHWPLKSIKDAGSLFSSVWNKDVGQINHKTVTLNEVEHEIIRKMGEPRIHMAIVCASISCPDLRDEPFTSKTLSRQLDEQTVNFLNNPGKGLRLKGRTAEVSKIFDWFEEDFDDGGGIGVFVKRYRTDLSKNIKVDADISYNWNLNK